MSGSNRLPSRRNATDSDFGRLVLRLALGVLILLHGYAKIKGGIDPIIGLMTKANLPVFLAFGVYIGEVIAPILLIVGLYSRVAAAIIAFNMAMAVVLVHANESFFMLNKNGGWALELEATYFLMAIAIVSLGAGRYSLGGEDGRGN